MPTWVHRRSDRIVDVLPPDRPDFLRYLAMLLPTLGLLTFFIVAGIVGHLAHRQAPGRNSRRRT